jgi:hypothetical protein
VKSHVDPKIMTHPLHPGPLTRRALLGGLAATACATSTGVGAQDENRAEPLGQPQSIAITARPIAAFQPSKPEVKRFGGLEFRGGLVLSSAAEYFGGWSGLVLEADGKSLLAISDRGYWLRATVDYTGGRPSALSRARIGSLHALRGRALKDKREQDAESLTLLDGTLDRGKLLIGFERAHRIGRFDIVGGHIDPPSEYLKLPPDSRRMPTNQGLEALAVIRAGPLRGSLVAFAERFTRGSGYHTGWIWVKGEPHRLQLRDIDGFDITDAVGLPDGGLLVLERYFRWMAGVSMRIRRLQAAEIRPGARLTGSTVFQGDSGYEIDNMEGVAVHAGTGGETVVSLISDDNFNRLLQRTVFLQFTLLD